MAIDFPASPSLDDTFTAGGVTYTWDGTVWAASGTAAFALKAGDTFTGNVEIGTGVDLNTDGSATFAGNVGIGNTPAVALDVNGEVRASTGILFGTDTAAVNTLDDYEEGTWTPGYAGDTTSGTYTYATQNGAYTKIGNQVTVHFTLLNITTGSAGSGGINITGLPFTIGTTDGVDSQGSVRISQHDVPVSTVSLSFQALQNTTEMRIICTRDSTSTTALLVTDKTSNQADIYGSCTYIVD